MVDEACRDRLLEKTQVFNDVNLKEDKSFIPFRYMVVELAKELIKERETKERNKNLIYENKFFSELEMTMAIIEYMKIKHPVCALGLSEYLEAVRALVEREKDEIEENIRKETVPLPFPVKERLLRLNRNEKWRKQAQEEYSDLVETYQRLEWIKRKIYDDENLYKIVEKESKQELGWIREEQGKFVGIVRVDENEAGKTIAVPSCDTVHDMKKTVEKMVLFFFKRTRPGDGKKMMLLDL
jgi:hypothetical protein